MLALASVRATQAWFDENKKCIRTFVYFQLENYCVHDGNSFLQIEIPYASSYEKIVRIYYVMRTIEKKLHDGSNIQNISYMATFETGR